MVKKNALSTVDEVKVLKAKLSAQKKEQKRALQIQRALYRIADAATAARDMQSFYKKLHKIIGGLMYAENFFIALYDKTTKLVSWPYFVDSVDKEPPEPRVVEDGPVSRSGTVYVIRHGLPIHANRQDADKLVKQGVLELEGALDEDWIGIPLKTGKQIIGVLVVQSYLKDVRYSDDDFKLLVFVAQHISAALTRARALDAERQRNAELAIINSVQEGLASELDLQSIIDLIGEKVGEIFKADTTAVGMIDPERYWLSNAYYVDRGVRSSVPDGPVQRPRLVAIAIDTCKPLLLGTKEEMIKLGAVQTPSPGGKVDKNESFLGVPILSNGKLIGLISVQSYKQYAYDQDDMRLLETLANSMSVALQNAQSFKAEQERVAELQIINSIQQGLAAELDFQAIVDLVGDKLREVFNTPNLGIHWYDEKANLIHFLYVYEHDNRLNLAPRPPLSGGTFEASIKTRKILILNNPADFEKNNAYIYPGTDQPKSSIAVPIISSDRFLGIINIENFERENAFGESELRLLTTIAASLGSALENARLFDETQRLFKAEQERVAELQIINSIQQGLAAELDFQAIVDLVGDKLREVFNTGDFGIRWYDEKINLIHFLYEYEHGIRLDIPPKPPTPGGSLEQLLRDRQPIIENTAEIFARTNDTTFPGTDTSKSLIAVPIISSDKVIGSLKIENFERENAFGESELRLLTTIAASLGTALENARLFDETQQRNAELAIINAVQGALAAELDIQGIYEAVGEKLRDIFKVQTITIYSFNRKEKSAILEYGYEKGEKYEHIVLPSNSLYDHIVELDKTFVLNNDFPQFAKQFKDYKVPRGEMPKSIVVVPILRSKDRNTKVLVSIQDVDGGKTFTESDVRLLETLASAMSVALQNARLFDEVQRKNAETTESLQQQTATSDILQVIARSPTDVQPVMQVIAEHSFKLCNGLFCAVYQSDGKFVDQVAQVNFTPEALEESLRSYPRLIRRDSSISSRVILDGEVIHLPDLQKDDSLPEVTHRYAKSLGMNCLLAVPMMRNQEAIGSIHVGKVDAAPFTDKQISLLQTFASQAVIAIENGRLFNELQNRNADITEALERETASNDILRVIAESPTDIQPVLEVIARNAAQLSGSDDAIIGLVEGDTLIVSTHFGDVPMIPVGEGIRFNRDSVAGRAMIDGVPLQGIHNQRGVKSEYPEGDRIAKKYGYRMSAGVPLMRKGKALGVITIRRTKPELLTDKQIVLVQSFANQAAIAVENVRLFEAEQQRVAELQVINSIQEGLAKQLDFQKIIDLVGEKVGEIFEADTSNVGMYDAERDWRLYIHYVDRGERTYFPDGPMNRPSLGAILLDSRKHLLLGTNEESRKLGSLSVASKGEKIDKNESYMGVPILTGDNPIGFIAVQSYKQHAYDQDDLRLMQTLANSMSIALENARLFDETQRLLKVTEQRNAELAIVNNVQLGLASKLDMQAIFELVGEKIRETFDSQVTIIAVYDHAGEQANYRYIAEKGGRFDGTIIPFNGFHRKMIQERKTILYNENLVEQVKTLGFEESFTDNDLPKSALNVPLLAGNQVLGHVALENLDREHAFSDSDVRLLETLANSMSVALESARLFDETQRLLDETEERNAELAVINSIQHGLASELEIQTIIDLVGDQVQKTFNVSEVEIAIYNPETRMISIPYWSTSDGRVQQDDLPLGKGVMSHIIQTRQPLIMSKENRKEISKMAIMPGGLPMRRSLIGAPIISGDEVIGAISLHDPQEEDAYDGSDLRLLTTIASSMAIALKNARLFDETQRLLKESEDRAAELAIINSIQQGLVSKLDMQSICDLVGDRFSEIFKEHGINLLLYDEETDIGKPMYVVERGERHYPPPMRPGAIGRKVMDQKKPLLLSTRAEFEAMGAMTIPGTEPSKSGIYAPLVINNKVIGALNIENPEYENVFTQSDLRLVTTITNSMSVALENARLFDETQRLLKETEERNAELAVITSVQQGLASKLDMHAIYDLIGDKIQEIFDAQVVLIVTHNKASNLADFPYAIEKGEHLNISSRSLAGITGYVIKTGESIMINENLAQGEEEILGFTAEIIAGEDVKSRLDVPMTVGNEVKGAISLQNVDREHAFTESDLRLLQTLANSMSVALENARLFDETQRLLKETEQRAAELALINSVQQGLVSKLDIQSIIDLVGDKIRDVFDTQTTYIALHDKQSHTFHIPYYLHRGQRMTVEGHHPAGRGPTGHIISTQETLLFNQDADKRTQELGATHVADDDIPLSWVGVPMIAGDEVVGVISLQNIDREYAYSDTDVSLLKTIASSLAVALQNAQLFEETNRLLKETEQRAGELSAISTVSQALVAETDLDNSIQLIGSQTRDIFDADIAYLGLLDHQTGMINFPYAYGDESIVPIKMGEGLTSRIIESGEPLLINKDISGRTAELGTKRVGKEALSYLGVPIVSGRETIGVLSVQSVTEEGVFHNDDLRLLTTIAANAGAAIQTAQLHAETQRRAREMATLAEIGNEIAASRELEPVLEKIAAHAREILVVRDIAIFLRYTDQNVFRASVALGKYPEQLKSVEITPNKGLAGHILVSGVAEYVNDPVHDSRLYHIPGTPVEEDEQEYIMGAPLISRGQIIGGIMVWRQAPASPFVQPDLDFLISVARQTAIAIESARLYLETQRRAREMSALVDVGRDISASLDAETVLESIATHAKDLLNGDLSALFLPEGDGNTFRAIAAVGHEANNVRNDTIKSGQGILGNIAKIKVGEIVNDVNNDPRAISIAGTEIAPDEHLLAVPLMANEELKGLMAVWRSGKGLEFIEAELEFLNGLSRQAVIAVQNAQLFNEINRRKEYFEVLFQNNPVAVVTIDNDARVTSWNPAAEELFGYTQTEALGKNVDDLVANMDELYSEAVGYSNTGLEVDSEAFQVLAKRTRKDGSLVDVELSGVPIVVQNNKLGMYALYHDITELQRARQEAIAANEAKSAFLATMSHEIRTPMNAVIGMSGLLLDTKLDKEQLEYAETIRNSGDALLAIINDILDFSKIEAGKMELEQQPFDLRECVESALDLVAARAVEKGLDLAYLIDDEVPVGIRGDVTRLRQILLNLLSNAVKFTEEGEVVLTVSKPKQGKNELLFTVRDTGVGISSNHMSRLFQSFSQADSSTTRKFGGTGLGLAISKRLAEMMGGDMWAESAGLPGMGSTFSFTIQAKSVKLATRKTKRDISSLQPALQNKRVLIVDDNATNRRILKLQTQKWGMQPRVTKSPKQALRWIRAGEPFELVILDMQMPDMDGLTLARSIRKVRSMEDLPLFLLTSLGRREVGAEDMDFAAFLTKPLKPSALFDALTGLFASNVVEKKSEPAKLSLDPGMAKRNPLKILLAEDNAVNQKLALRLLEQMGYRADVASNGIEAVESIERQMYDVILMDVQMPEMDGLEATRQIRKKDIVQPYIIAMTANAMQGDREMCLEAGMNFYVAKPIRVAELVAALNLVREKTK